MSTRVHYEITASNIDRYPAIPAYAVLTDDDITRGHAAARSIARAWGLDIITVREDSRDMDGSTIHYAATLGHRVSGGGWSPEAEVVLHVQGAE